MLWGDTGTVVFWADRTVGIPSFCPAPPCPAAPPCAALTRRACGVFGSWTRQVFVLAQGRAVILLFGLADRGAKHAVVE